MGLLGGLFDDEDDVEYTPEELRRIEIHDLKFEADRYKQYWEFSESECERLTKENESLKRTINLLLKQFTTE